MIPKKYWLHVPMAIIAGVVIGLYIGLCVRHGRGEHRRYSSDKRERAAEMQPQGKLGATQWAIQTLSGVKFEFPTTWKLTEDEYCTPAGICDKSGITLMPPIGKAGEDKIGIGGPQVTCAMFSNNRIKCKEVDGLAFYTASVVPDILFVYNHIVSTASTTVRAQ